MAGGALVCIGRSAAGALAPSNSQEQPPRNNFRNISPAPHSQFQRDQSALHGRNIPGLRRKNRIKYGIWLIFRCHCGFGETIRKNIGICRSRLSCTLALGRRFTTIPEKLRSFKTRH